MGGHSRIVAKVGGRGGYNNPPYRVQTKPAYQEPERNQELEKFKTRTETKPGIPKFTNQEPKPVRRMKPGT